MTETMIYWLGSAAAIAGGLAVVGALFLIVGWLVIQAAAYMLRNGLHVIRLSNWMYWNNRMHKEGLICMQKFYREQVAIHKPKSLEEFQTIDRAADDHAMEESRKQAAAATGKDMT